MEAKNVMVIKLVKTKKKNRIKVKQTSKTHSVLLSNDFRKTASAAAMFQNFSFKNCFNTTKKMDRLKCCLHTPLFFQLVVDIAKVAMKH